METTQLEVDYASRTIVTIIEYRAIRERELQTKYRCSLCAGTVAETVTGGTAPAAIHVQEET